MGSPGCSAVAVVGCMAVAVIGCVVGCVAMLLAEKGTPAFASVHLQVMP